MNRNIIIVGFAVVFLVTVVYYALNQNGMMPEGATADRTTGVVNEMQVNSGENAAPGSAVHDLPVEPAAARARADLAKKLGIEEKSIVIMLIEEKEWGDGCLGLGGPAESCLMAIVPGFRVEMQTNEKTHIYRTDKTGLSVREETGSN